MLIIHSPSRTYLALRHQLASGGLVLDCEPSSLHKHKDKTFPTLFCSDCRQTQPTLDLLYGNYEHLGALDKITVIIPAQ